MVNLQTFKATQEQKIIVKVSEEGNHLGSLR